MEGYVEILREQGLALVDNQGNLEFCTRFAVAKAVLYATVSWKRNSIQENN